MDPITFAIITALGKLGENVIKDAYDALKAAIAHKCGVDADLTKAVDELEKKPTSTGRQETLKEEIAATEANQDPELLSLAKTLLDKLDEFEDQPKGSTIIDQQAGDNAIQVGQVGRDMNIKR